MLPAASQLPHGCADALTPNLAAETQQQSIQKVALTIIGRAWRRDRANRAVTAFAAESRVQSCPDLASSPAGALKEVRVPMPMPSPLTSLINKDEEKFRAFEN